MKFWLMLAPLVLAAGCGDKGEDTADPITEILALSGDASSGEELYPSHCAACHGADGEGGTAPSMTELIPPLSDEEIVDAIYGGTSGGMPAYSAQLSEQEIADVLAYLVANFGA